MSGALQQMLLASGSGVVSGTGSFTGIEGADVLDFTGVVTDPNILAAIEGADIAALTGTVPILGSLAATEGADTAAMLGGTILDGTSPTFVISLSRVLISGYADPLYDDTAGAITSIRDQTETGDYTDSGVAGRRPALTTAGPNSVACARFDGSSDFLSSAVAISGYMTNASKFIVLSLIPTTINTTARAAFGLVDARIQIQGFNDGANDLLRVVNNDGVADTLSCGTVTEGTAYVITLRHEGGTLFGSINGAAESSIASGNTNSMTSLPRFGTTAGSSQFAFDLFECVMYGATIPDATKRGEIIADFMDHIGAV